MIQFFREDFSEGFLFVAVLVLACQAMTSCKNNIAVGENHINSNNNNNNKARSEAD